MRRRKESTATPAAPPSDRLIAWGSPMSAIYPPENQQSPSQPSAEVRPPPRRPHRARRVLFAVGLLAVLGIGVGIGEAGHSTGISQASYKASLAQVSSLKDQVSSLKTQVATDNTAVATARTQAATAQQTANANAAAAYRTKNAALEATYQAKEATLRTQEN